MDQHEHAIELDKKYSSSDKLNEADTRNQIINSVLQDVLGWPKQLVSCEEHISDTGYADYICKRADKSPMLIIEAKKEGVEFSVPDTLCPDSSSSYVFMRTLLTNESISKAIEQVRAYCLEIGVQFGGITNGHQWVIFRVFESGVSWKSLKAFVINGLGYFSKSFTDAINNLGYESVTNRNALNNLLSPRKDAYRETYNPKDGIRAYEVSITANHYAPQLRPIADRFFGILDEHDPELMDSCYVSDRDYERVFDAARRMLSDSVTPYLEQYSIRDVEDDGPTFENRLAKSITRKLGTDVVVLFGGKGIGKSTFLRRLLFLRPPQVIKKHSVSAIIDLLNVPMDRNLIHDEIWDQAIRQLDPEQLLSSDRSVLLNLFHDKYDIAKRQQLFGLDEGSIEYNMRLNDLISTWLSDKKYCLTSLAKYHRKHHKGVIVVIDNTDQFGKELQEFCFTTAHEISSVLGCLTIISMREERFYASTIHGVLDAYQNSGFHLSAPPPKHVFLKRIEYVIKRLSSGNGCDEFLPARTTPDDIDRLSKLFRTFESEFRNDASHLTGFLTACAHGNIRLALELFRGLLQSRYTNVNEITSVNGYWTFQVHQVLKPIMIPYRFFYDENQSHVPNVFQSRSRLNGSHFTALRILSTLNERAESGNQGYVSIHNLSAPFNDRFSMADDFRLNLDVMLRYGLVEANNRIDEYSSDVDEVRITSYGRYLFEELSKRFTYIELISTDTVIHEPLINAALVLLSNEEYVLWELPSGDSSKRIERVEKRINKADEFISYLEGEERREAEMYGLSKSDCFMGEIRTEFNLEKDQVIRSAKRQNYRN